MPFKRFDIIRSDGVASDYGIYLGRFLYHTIPMHCICSRSVWSWCIHKVSIDDMNAYTLMARPPLSGLLSIVFPALKCAKLLDDITIPYLPFTEPFHGDLDMFIVDAFAQHVP